MCVCVVSGPNNATIILQSDIHQTLPEQKMSKTINNKTIGNKTLQMYIRVALKFNFRISYFSPSHNFYRYNKVTLVNFDHDNSPPSRAVSGFKISKQSSFLIIQN